MRPYNVFHLMEVWLLDEKDLISTVSRFQARWWAFARDQCEVDYHKMKGTIWLIWSCSRVVCRRDVWTQEI
jgi:hypothetical protein